MGRASPSILLNVQMGDLANCDDAFNLAATRVLVNGQIPQRWQIPEFTEPTRAYDLEASLTVGTMLLPHQRVHSTPIIIR